MTAVLFTLVVRAVIVQTWLPRVAAMNRLSRAAWGSSNRKSGSIFSAS